VVEQKNAEGAIKTGKLNLVDLAGSEKVKKTEATGQTLEEVMHDVVTVSLIHN
jgi:kinesin family protein 5